MHNSAWKFFQRSPSQFFEHPTDLPIDSDKIPNGPIAGWMVFAPEFRGDPSLVVGPVQPVVERPYEDDQLCVKVGKTQYWYGCRDRYGVGRPNWPCWYQSGMRLRFFREPNEAPLVEEILDLLQFYLAVNKELSFDQVLRQVMESAGNAKEITDAYWHTWLSMEVEKILKR